MQGTIETRTRKNARDVNGKLRAAIKVYDVRYNYRDPATGQIVRKKKRGFLRRIDAEEFLLQINKAQQEGVFLTPEKLTLSTYLNTWLSNYAKVNVKASTYAQYEAIVKKRLIPWAGGCDIKSITPMQIDEFYATLLQQGRADGKGGLSAKSVLYIHRVLNEALGHAVQKGLLVKNPLLSVTNIPKAKKFKASAYSAEEIRSLLEAAAAESSFWQAAIALAAICGLRRGECLGLKWSKIDFDNQSITIDEQVIDIHHKIHFSTPKSTESIRTIHAPTEVFAILKRRKEELDQHKEWLGSAYDAHDLVLCRGNGSSIRPGNFTKAFKDFLARHNMRTIRFHDLRHSCASLMLQSGVAMKTASEILGHSSIAITADLYTHVMQKTKEEAAGKIGDYVLGTQEK